MQLFKSRGIVTIVGGALLTVVALTFVVPRYVEWSSDTALAEFMGAARYRRLINPTPKGKQVAL